jgi:hypothetical protein
MRPLPIKTPLLILNTMPFCMPSLRKADAEKTVLNFRHVFCRAHILKAGNSLCFGLRLKDSALTRPFPAAQSRFAFSAALRKGKENFEYRPKTVQNHIIQAVKRWFT